ncbi:MAG: HAMP domain-containing sensor histidine kinase [Rhizomicrobium sp.]
MRKLKLPRTLAFRIVLIYFVAFALSAGAIVAFTYLNTVKALNGQTDRDVSTEANILSDDYYRLGIVGLIDNIIARYPLGAQGHLYLLAHSGNVRVVGNLDDWPQTQSLGGDIVEFNYEARQRQIHRARGQVIQLSGDYELLVARDVYERYRTEHQVTKSLPWSVLLMVVLGIAGGALISHQLLARLDAINRTSREIMAGDLSRRVPVGGTGDEFDSLSENLNRMLDRTERLMKGMRQVTDSIAHDLRTPLNRLRNRLESISSGIDHDSPEGAAIDSAIAETDRLIATFNALLLIAEAEAGVAREAMAPLDLRSVVEGVGELYSPLAEEKNIALDIEPSGEAIISGNKSLISQALANLIDNAIKYTPEGGQVRVAVKQSPGAVALSVADTGPGIAPQDRARVLERFVRLEESRNSPGTGLGLSLVAAVARLHDAKLTLEDNAPGLRAVLMFPSRRTNA